MSASFAERLFDERGTLKDADLCFFMGVPYHKNIGRDRISFVSKTVDVKVPIVHPQFPKIIDHVKLMALFKKGSERPEVMKDLEELGKIVQMAPEWKNVAAICYFLAVDNKKIAEEHPDDYYTPFVFVYQGIEEEKILCKEDAFLVIRTAYYGDHVRLLRNLVGIPSLKRAMNIVEGVVKVTGGSYTFEKKTELRNHLLHDLFLNRGDLSKDVLACTHPWIQEEWCDSLVQNVISQRNVRIALRTVNTKKVAIGSSKWSFVNNNDQIDFFGCRSEEEKCEQFTCSYTVLGRTCSFEEITSDVHNGLNSESLSQILLRKGPMYDPGHFVDPKNSK